MLLPFFILGMPEKKEMKKTNNFPTFFTLNSNRNIIK